MEWELSKENVQPLRKGRNVDVLNNALKAKFDHTLKNNVSTQRRKLLEAIETYAGDDPLEPWIRCIEWTQEAYPSGGAQSGLLPMLELCVRTFRDNEKYRTDLRYLRVWMNYADRCTDPRDIFKFLEINEIGKTHALFYESYAKYMEKCRDFSKANEILSLGISRKAEPVQRLKCLYREFLKRSSKVAKCPMIEDTDNLLAKNKRSFGEIGTAPAKPARKIHALQPTGKANPKINSSKGLSIYVDPEFGPESVSPAPQIEKPLWTNLPSQVERSKENIQQPSKWTKAKIPQKPTGPPPADQLHIFVDEEFISTDVVKSHGTKDCESMPLKIRLDNVGDLKRETEMLRQRPLARFLEDMR